MSRRILIRIRIQKAYPDPDPGGKNCTRPVRTTDPVLRIRDVYPGSRIRLFPSRIQTVSIPDPGSALKNLSILTQKNQIPVPDPDFLPIPDPGVKKAPDPGSATLTDTIP